MNVHSARQTPGLHAGDVGTTSTNGLHISLGADFDASRIAHVDDIETMSDSSSMSTLTTISTTFSTIPRCQTYVSDGQHKIGARAKKVVVEVVVPRAPPIRDWLGDSGLLYPVSRAQNKRVRESSSPEPSLSPKQKKPRLKPIVIELDSSSTDSDYSPSPVPALTPSSMRTLTPKLTIRKFVTPEPLITKAPRQQTAQANGQKVCHQCRNSKSKHPRYPCPRCSYVFCGGCLTNRYGWLPDELQKGCAMCRRICNCSICMDKARLGAFKVRLRDLVKEGQNPRKWLEHRGLLTEIAPSPSTVKPRKFQKKVRKTVLREWVVDDSSANVAALEEDLRIAAEQRVEAARRGAPWYIGAPPPRKRVRLDSGPSTTAPCDDDKNSHVVPVPMGNIGAMLPVLCPSTHASSVNVAQCSQLPVAEKHDDEKDDGQEVYAMAGPDDDKDQDDKDQDDKDSLFDGPYDDDVLAPSTPHASLPTLAPPIPASSPRKSHSIPPLSATLSSSSDSASKHVGVPRASSEQPRQSTSSAFRRTSSGTLVAESPPPSMKAAGFTNIEQHELVASPDAHATVSVKVKPVRTQYIGLPLRRVLMRHPARVRVRPPRSPMPTPPPDQPAYALMINTFDMCAPAALPPELVPDEVVDDGARGARAQETWLAPSPPTDIVAWIMKDM